MGQREFETEFLSRVSRFNLQRINDFYQMRLSQFIEPPMGIAFSIHGLPMLSYILMDHTNELQSEKRMSASFQYLLRFQPSEYANLPISGVRCHFHRREYTVKQPTFAEFEIKRGLPKIHIL